MRGDVQTNSQDRYLHKASPESPRQNEPRAQAPGGAPVGSPQATLQGIPPGNPPAFYSFINLFIYAFYSFIHFEKETDTETMLDRSGESRCEFWYRYHPKWLAGNWVTTTFWLGVESRLPQIRIPPSHPPLITIRPLNKTTSPSSAYLEANPSRTNRTNILRFSL
jgi:hypothetical protein